MATGAQSEQHGPIPVLDQRAPDAGGLVAKAYLTAVLFVALFVVLLAFGSKVSPSLSQPPWALFVAAALTIPVLVPWLAHRVLPRLHSVKIANVEIALQEVRVPLQLASLAAQALSANLTDDLVLSEYAGRMTSLSSSIVDAIKAVQGAEHEVLPVDLATRWVVPNLYFLALMATQKTRVRQIAFVDSRVVPDRFVCTSSPEEVITALEWRHAELREAAQAARFDQDPRSAEPAAGTEFFQQLGAIYARTLAASTERVVTLTPETLLWILGDAAHRDAVQWVDPPGERVYRAVLASHSPFVAALRESHLLFLVSRDRLGTSVARTVLHQLGEQ